MVLWAIRIKLHSNHVCTLTNAHFEQTEGCNQRWRMTLLITLLEDVLRTSKIMAWWIMVKM